MQTEVILVLPVNAAGGGGGDYCPNNSPGCKCWDGTDPETGIQLSPPGCYDQAAEHYECHGGDWCEEDPN